MSAGAAFCQFSSAVANSAGIADWCCGMWRVVTSLARFFAGRPESPLNVLAQLNVPVSKVDKMLPTVVVMEGEIDLDERTPFRTLRFADEMHAGLLRGAVRLE